MSTDKPLLSSRHFPSIITEILFRHRNHYLKIFGLLIGGIGVVSFFRFLISYALPYIPFEHSVRMLMNILFGILVLVLFLYWQTVLVRSFLDHLSEKQIPVRTALRDARNWIYHVILYFVSLVLAMILGTIPTPLFYLGTSYLLSYFQVGSSLRTIVYGIVFLVSLFIFLSVATYVALKSYLFVPVILFEEQGFWPAIKRSYTLLEDHSWHDRRTSRLLTYVPLILALFTPLLRPVLIKLEPGLEGHSHLLSGIIIVIMGLFCCTSSVFLAGFNALIYYIQRIKRKELNLPGIQTIFE